MAGSPRRHRLGTGAAHAAHPPDGRPAADLARLPLFGNIFGEDMLLVAFPLGITVLSFTHLPIGCRSSCRSCSRLTSMQALVFTVLSSTASPHAAARFTRARGGRPHAH
jgi:hypothetical protein